MKVGDIVRLKWTRTLAVNRNHARVCRCSQCKDFDFRGHAMKNSPFIITAIDLFKSWAGEGFAVEAMSPDGTVVDLDSHELTTRGPFVDSRVPDPKQ